MTVESKKILRRSLDEYCDASEERKAELRDIVKNKLETYDTADLIGFEGASDFTDAAEVFLYITED